MGVMGSRTNRSALASMVRALRAAEQLEAKDVALVRLGELLAGKLDSMLAAPDEKAYAVAAVGRLYFAVEEALRSTPEVPETSWWDEFSAVMSTPTLRTDPPEWGARRRGQDPPS